MSLEVGRRYAGANACAWAVALALVLTTAWAPPAASQPAPDTPLAVAIVRDGPSETLDRATDAIAAELAELLPDMVQVTVADGDWTLDGAAHALDEALATPGLGAIVTLGPLTARAVGKSGELPMPVVVALAAPMAVESLDPTDNRPWAYRAGLLDLENDLARLQSVAPVARVAVLIEEAGWNAMPDPATALAPVDLPGLRLLPVRVPPAPGAPLSELPSDVDAVVLGLLLQTSDARRAEIIAEATSRGLPVVASVDPSDLEAGALLTTLPDRAWPLRARRVVLALQALLEGVPSVDLRGPQRLADRFALNLDAAAALELSPPFEVLQDAEPFGRGGDAATLTLADLVEQTIARNPGLAADEQALRVGESRVDRARSPRLPQVGLEARGIWLDADRARGPAPPAEQTLSWSATLSQSIFSATLLGDDLSERALQEGREAAYDAQRLDLVLTAGARYIDLLGAITTESVQRENLERVRANLALAEVRVGVGSEGREEIFRWQIELAQSQQEVVRAAAARQQAEIAINELRDEPLDTPVAPDETGYQDLAMLAVDARLEAWLADPASLERLVDFTSEQAEQGSPELQALDAQIEAARRTVDSRERRLYIPDLSLEAALNNRLVEGGEGADEPPIPGFSVPDDWDWSLALVARLPLATGGGRLAELDGARAGLAQLEAQRRETAVAIEGQVRARLEAVNASHQTLALSTEAAEAAEQNLELVRDAYERGAVDLIRLVDAQAQSLVTALAHANAAFQFLRDFLQVERAMGAMSFGPHALDLDAFFGDLDVYSGHTSEVP